MFDTFSSFFRQIIVMHPSLAAAFFVVDFAPSLTQILVAEDGGEENGALDIVP